jgi:hypothetical protein
MANFAFQGGGEFETTGGQQQRGDWPMTGIRPTFNKVNSFSEKE